MNQLNSTDQQHSVDAFLIGALEAFVSFIDELQESGRIITLDDLRAELVKLALSCREYGN